MVVGSPAKVLRTLSEEEQAGLASWADHYLVTSEAYRKRGIIHESYRR
jgi:carbonic anhydrase/acetyltransferase-like protein (isoleucine patch superfamily)